MYKPKINEEDTHANALSLLIIHTVEYILNQSFIHALITIVVLSQWQLRRNMYGTLTGNSKFSLITNFSIYTNTLQSSNCFLHKMPLKKYLPLKIFLLARNIVEKKHQVSACQMIPSIHNYRVNIHPDQQSSKCVCLPTCRTATPTATPATGTRLDSIHSSPARKHPRS